MVWLILVALGIIVVLVAIILFIFGLKLAVKILINSLIGFFALYAVKAFLLSEIVINFWSVLLTALLGIFGFIIVLVLHLLNIAF